MSVPQKKSLVLVVGAGASSEVGLPLGAGLKREIAGALKWHESETGIQWAGDKKVHAAIEVLTKGNAYDRRAFLQAAIDIRNGVDLTTSIDSFINIHRDNRFIADCAKLVIASCILNAEGRSTLQIDRSNVNNTIAFNKLESTWFNPFFRLLTDNCHKRDLPARLRMVSIITFNYDRCIEHYLHGALQHLYRESSEWATETLKSLDIYHPYGKVGALPWMVGPTTTIEFGQKAHSAQLIELARQLLTFSEGINADTSSIAAIRRDLSGAERIAFLGFAFHSLNLDLLFDGHDSVGEAVGRTLYGTASGISETDIATIAADIPQRTGRPRYDRCKFDSKLTCASLFHEYRLSLSLS